jgi:hypothetical protein
MMIWCFVKINKFCDMNWALLSMNAGTSFTFSAPLSYSSMAGYLSVCTISTTTGFSSQTYPQTVVLFSLHHGFE